MKTEQCCESTRKSLGFLFEFKNMLLLRSDMLNNEVKNM
jgi:hypothetical protein